MTNTILKIPQQAILSGKVSSLRLQPGFHVVHISKYHMDGGELSCTLTIGDRILPAETLISVKLPLENCPRSRRASSKSKSRG
jgi:hypothetical protein